MQGNRPSIVNIPNDVWKTIWCRHKALSKIIGASHGLLIGNITDNSCGCIDIVCEQFKDGELARWDKASVF